jgi:hypothetical protein
MMMENLVEWRLAGEPKYSGKPAPAPLCPPQIPLDQTRDRTRDRTRAAAVGSLRLTAWAMARPSFYLVFVCFSSCSFSSKRCVPFLFVFPTVGPDGPDCWATVRSPIRFCIMSKTCLCSLFNSFHFTRFECPARPYQLTFYKKGTVRRHLPKNDIGPQTEEGIWLNFPPYG